MSKEIIRKGTFTTEKGNLIVLVAWRVPKSSYYPEGIKYSFQLICKGKRVVGYDNYNNEGHHRHFLSIKEKIEFRGLKETRKMFFKVVEIFEELQNET